MTAHHVTSVTALATALALLIGVGPGWAQDSTTRSVIEQGTPDGGSRTLSDVETSTTEVAPGTQETTRREYGTDANGDSTLLATISETRVTRADGGESVVREVSHPDVNGRSQTMRRETSETVAEGDGVFRTEVEVATPDSSGSRLVTRERIEQVERRTNETIERESVTYSNVSSRGDWRATELRVTTESPTDGGVESVESVYRPDGSGSMVLRDEIVRTEWTGSRGQEHTREHVYATDIPGQGRTSDLRLYQQIDTVRTTRANGSVQTTREVTEQRGGRDVVVERVVERSRSDGRGGTIVERETQRRDINGQLRTVATTTERER